MAIRAHSNSSPQSLMPVPVLASQLHHSMTDYRFWSYFQHLVWWQQWRGRDIIPSPIYSGSSSLAEEVPSPILSVQWSLLAIWVHNHMSTSSQQSSLYLYFIISSDHSHSITDHSSIFHCMTAMTTSMTYLILVLLVCWYSSMKVKAVKLPCWPC